MEFLQVVHIVDLWVLALVRVVEIVLMTKNKLLVDIIDGEINILAHKKRTRANSLKQVKFKAVNIDSVTWHGLSVYLVHFFAVQNLIERNGKIKIDFWWAKK